MDSGTAGLGAAGANGIIVIKYTTAGAVSSSTWIAADATLNGATLSNGGATLTPSTTSGAWGAVRGTQSQTSGKWYIEFLTTTSTSGSSLPGYGLASSSFIASSYLGSGNYSAGIWLGNANLVSTGFTNNYPDVGLGAGAAAGDVIGLAVDFTTGGVWIARNNVWSGTSNPATGVAPIVSFTPATVGALFPGMSFFGEPNSGTWTLQPTVASQKYAAPSGFTAWG
jgi:hypothetical protein